MAPWEHAALANTKHGAARNGRMTRAYKAWLSMKQRCYLPSTTGYANYGGRGITVCDRWRHSFVAFREDMGEPPPGMSLDRIDGEGNYEPGNCRWADQRTQVLNRRVAHLVTYQGKTQPLQLWADDFGVPYQRLWARVVRLGWGIERALNTPALNGGGPRRDQRG